MDDALTSPIGQATMSSGILSAVRYHRYIYRSLAAHLGLRVWEIGSGYGQYTDMLLAEKRAVLASDIDRALLDKLRSRIAAKGTEIDYRYVDLCAPETIAECLAWKPDSILCLNVLEHIADDHGCLRSICEGAPSGVRAVFLTPAHQALFGFMDSEAGHFRRYTRSSLRMAFEGAGWRVQKDFYLNPVGGAGWFVRNRLLPPASKNLNDPAVNRDIELFDRYFLPISRALEPLTGSFFGQSVVVIAEKR